MTRFVRRWITSAVLSVSIVAAAVSASYGQEKVVLSDVAWRPGS